MAHYHIFKDEKTTLGIPSDGGHSHRLADGALTEPSGASPGHTHNVGEDFTGLAIPLSKGAFTDTQVDMAEMFGHNPDDIYLGAFEDKKSDLHIMRKKIAMIFIKHYKEDPKDPMVLEKYYNDPRVISAAKARHADWVAIRKEAAKLAEHSRKERIAREELKKRGWPLSDICKQLGHEPEAFDDLLHNKIVNKVKTNAIKAYKVIKKIIQGSGFRHLDTNQKRHLLRNLRRAKEKMFDDYMQNSDTRGAQRNKRTLELYDEVEAVEKLLHQELGIPIVDKNKVIQIKTVKDYEQYIKSLEGKIQNLKDKAASLPEGSDERDMILDDIYSEESFLSVARDGFNRAQAGQLPE